MIVVPSPSPPFSVAAPAIGAVVAGLAARLAAARAHPVEAELPQDRARRKAQDRLAVPPIWPMRP